MRIKFILISWPVQMPINLSALDTVKQKTTLFIQYKLIHIPLTRLLNHPFQLMYAWHHIGRKQ